MPDFCLQTHNFDKNHIKVILPTQSKKKSIIVLTNIYKFFFLASPPGSQSMALSTVASSMEFNPKAEYLGTDF